MEREEKWMKPERGRRGKGEEEEGGEEGEGDEMVEEDELEH
jgi:hypothetical protein